MKQRPTLFDLSRQPGQPKRRKKVTLVFDEAKRKEFLSGFRKRKLERKQKAREDLERLLREEKKKIKENAKENLKKMLSHRPVPEVEEFLNKTEFEMADKTVSILELDINDLETRTSTIGSNKVNYESDDGEHQNTSEEELEDKTKDENNPNKRSKIGNVKNLFRKSVLKQVQKTKAFKAKQNLQRVKNKKESRKKGGHKNKVKPGNQQEGHTKHKEKRKHKK